MQFIQARHYTPTPGRNIDLVVLHDMEHPDVPTAAEDVAAWFAGISSPQASAHYCVDADSVVQCVRDQDVAWHAPGANHNGIGIEQAGYKDRVSDAIVTRAASLTAQLSARYHIPLVYVDAVGLRAGMRGVTTHADVSAAFHKSDHTDPGRYPMERFLARAHNTATPPSSKLEPRMKFLPAAPIVDVQPCGPGQLILDEMGHVYAVNGAPYHGGYWDLDPRARQGTRTFVGLENVTAEGYRLRSILREPYDFGKVG